MLISAAVLGSVVKGGMKPVVVGPVVDETTVEVKGGGGITPRAWEIGSSSS